ncbi:NADH-quinone oxidoreductase subunit A [Candidatus Hakubella thermalkaliphila]|uniref:NADH-quinone oxidoreductase subunit A n=1 Tax=Candidatus Hakubella thermalkaliphila TaxID=2754717 RepID=A0A6V8NLP2_9ACTN|nr:NADH-quinone oxidoreductase subunit A [Candidatus Hakubella thermalkaliphila]GFP21198.1 NADH-quinone oxidoreductase subunit A [Candidatus Hakubella thermalkaliphila]
MVADYFNNYITLLAFILTGMVFLSLVLFLCRLVAPRNPIPDKFTTYECGMIPLGMYWSHFHVRYYIFALLFVIFKIGTVFLYPWAVLFRSLGLFGFVAIIIFWAILFPGLLYAWKKGVLKWV